MQQNRKPSFLKSILGLKQQQPKKSSRKAAPTPLDERQIRQVAGGEGTTGLPKGGW
ncbi:MAG: hypothetical protein U1E89_09465 [Burkholderiaceae bacterium]